MANRIGYPVALLVCVACAGSKPAVEEPAPPPDTENAPTAESPAGEAPTEPDESTPASESAPEPAETKKKCEELDKSTCKVTVGCGWNDLKKCVSDSTSE